MDTDDDSSAAVVIIPVIVVIVVLVIAITFLIRCYQSKRKAALQIRENFDKQLADTDSGYVESQYVLKADGDKSNIFASTSVASHKLRIADAVVDTDANAESRYASNQSHADTSGNLSNTASKFNSIAKLNVKGEVNLGDTMNFGQHNRE